LIPISDRSLSRDLEDAPMKHPALGAVLAATLILHGPTWAQEFPSSAITVVTPLAPGTTIDILARLYGERLSRRFGQQVIVSNRPGAGGLIAAQAVAAAPADGYTLLLANSGHTILGTLNKNLPFDPVRDFAGITLIGETAAVVVVPPSLGARTLQAFVDIARAKPRTLNYGSAGIGTATHLAGAYFARQAAIDMVHVPYKTGSALIADLLEGRIQVTFSPAAFTLPMLQDGRLLALAVSSREPLLEPVAVPTALSANVDYEYATWYGFLAPVKTPATILQTLDRTIEELGREVELQAKIVAQGITPRSVGLHDFDRHIRRDMDRLEPLLKDIGIQIGN
jgi:tripartite-type tricarboxylate transporter receptor subunit TctC